MSDSPEIACDRLLQNTLSLQLATVGENGFPHCGYTPFVVDEVAHDEASTASRQFFIFVSELALHTRDLQNDPRASIMIIEDEAASKQIFARTRLYYECEALIVPPDDSRYSPLLDDYQERHGKMVGLLRELPDFKLFRLIPQQGQFVMGFGKAFKLCGPGLREFEHSRRA